MMRSTTQAKAVRRLSTPTSAYPQATAPFAPRAFGGVAQPTGEWPWDSTTAEAGLLPVGGLQAVQRQRVDRKIGDEEEEKLRSLQRKRGAPHSLARIELAPSGPSTIQRRTPAPALGSVLQLRMKFVETSARRHYDDGWGELYGIQDDPTLKDEVQNAELGNWTRDLGEYYHEDEEVTRPCTVGYRNRQGQREVLTSIYHCGPSSQ